MYLIVIAPKDPFRTDLGTESPVQILPGILPCEHSPPPLSQTVLADLSASLESICATGTHFSIDVYSAISSTLVGVEDSTTARVSALLHK